MQRTVFKSDLPPLLSGVRNHSTAVGLTDAGMPSNTLLLAVAECSRRDLGNLKRYLWRDRAAKDPIVEPLCVPDVSKPQVKPVTSFTYVQPALSASQSIDPDGPRANPHIHPFDGSHVIRVCPSYQAHNRPEQIPETHPGMVVVIGAAF